MDFAAIAGLQNHNEYSGVMSHGQCVTAHAHKRRVQVPFV